ncbi:hypothetical protein ACFSUK_29390 [Sphingobium scionense]
MKGRLKLFPMMLALVLVTGCKGSSDDSAEAAPVSAPQQVAVAVVQPDAPPPAPRRPALAPGADRHRRPARPDQFARPAALRQCGPARPFPREVTAFMVDRDSCDHFRGEEPYDAERRAYIEESVAELCSGTDVKLALLRKRYEKLPDVISALSSYDARIEGEEP